MADTEWLDEHIELFAADALATDEHDRVQRELATLTTVERSIYEGRIDEIHTAMSEFASAYALDAPAGLRDRVLGRIADEPPARPVSAPVEMPDEPDEPGHNGTVVPIDRSRNRRRWATGIAAAAAAVVVALGAGVIIGRSTAPEQPAPPPIAQTQQQVAEVLAAPDAQLSAGRLDDNRGVVSVVTSRDRNQAVAVLRDPRNPIPVDSEFQLWLVGKAAQPVSAGLVPPGRAGAPTLVDALDGASVLAVTIEPRGGSPQPTTPILVQVPI
ncbi:anti-sigma factor [Gordonia sp. CPCC 205515]|uniref:anti-sigma factor n=1 Tax=Gordonia sp. CPCC 205515 TaxID=3140791 RepID=UPI003AF34E23